MITFDLILKIIITAMLGYLVFNTFLHYHFSMDRILVGFFVFAFLSMIYYLGEDKVIEFLILIGILIVLFFGLYVFSNHKKRSGYILFHSWKRQYSENRKLLIQEAEELGIDTKSIYFDRCKPYLVVIRNQDPKLVRKMFKKLDNIDQKKPKRFTMFHYWVIIAYLIIVAILWRFVG